MAEELNPFKIAQKQLETAAKLLDLDGPTTELLKWPLKEFVYTVPFKLDDGSTKVTRQYLRCQVEELMVATGELKETMGKSKVMINGDLAVVWAPYKLYRSGSLDHYGVNAVSLLKTDGKWKIATIVYNKIEKK